MAREFTRSRRVEEQIQRILADVLRSDLRDPRVADVVITQVKAARDLSVAWVQYSLLDVAASADQRALDAVQAGLASAAGFIRSRLASGLATRTVPELRFQFDAGPQRSRDLESLIDAAVAADESRRPAAGQAHEPSSRPRMGPDDGEGQ